MNQDFVEPVIVKNIIILDYEQYTGNYFEKNLFKFKQLFNL